MPRKHRIKFGSCDDTARWLSAATGIKYTPDELRKTAHRIRLLVDAYNVLCAREIGEEPVVAKPIESLASFPIPGRPKDPEELRKLQEDYCGLRGYDPETGVPRGERLEMLGMEDVADKLAASVENHSAKQSPKPKKVRISQKKSG